jgi:hypothetical protein
MSNRALASSLALLVLTACGDKKAGAPAGGEPASNAGQGAGQATGPAAPATPPTPLPALPADPGGHSGKHRFSARLGGVMADAGRAVAVDGAGNVAVAGYVRDVVDLGGGQRLTAEDADGFVALFGKDGVLRWARNFGGKGGDAAEAVAFDPQGNVIVAGAFSYAIEMADGKLTSRGADDIFVVKLDGEGRRLWAKRFGGDDVDAVYGAATDAAGNIYLVGEMGQRVTIGTTELKSEGGADILVFKLSPAGEPLWARRFGALGADYGRAIRLSPDGSVVVLGEMSRAVDFGGGPIESAGNRDAVVFSLTTEGEYRWATRFGGHNDELALGLAIDPAGSIAVTGSLDSSFEFAGQTVKSRGLADAYVASLAADGTPRWIRTFGSKESDIAAGVTSDPHGNLYAVGWFWYRVDFGAGELESAGRKDAFVLALDRDGKTLWAQRFGDTENDFLQAIASGPDGAPVAAGTFHRTVSFGGEPLTSGADPAAQLPLGDVVVVGFER